MSLSATRNAYKKSFVVDRQKAIDWDLELSEFLQSPDPLGVQKSGRELELKVLRRWMQNRQDVMKKFGLITDLEDGTQMVFGRSLTSIGVTTPSEGNRFVKFYDQVCDPSRSWTSGCQVDQEMVATIALTPNYNRLPDWVRAGLMNAPVSAQIGGDRIGNIWRLIPCVKTWKWCKELPKKYAEKIGKCSPRLRMLAAWAWPNSTDAYPGDTDGNGFWEVLSAISRMPLSVLIEWMLDGQGYSPDWVSSHWTAFLSEELSVPYDCFKSLFKTARIEYEDEYKRIGIGDMRRVITTLISRYGNPSDACNLLFGVAGKSTIAAFHGSATQQIKWAQAIGEKNADNVQKILRLRWCVDFQEDSIAFLLSLPMSARLRLLENRTFTYRGSECEITSDHVRDTGYLWANIAVKPRLGRVRCWFSVHEVLSKEFVAELPDEALPVPSGWEPVDGLCSVDGRWSIEMPKSVATLKYWGVALKNCLGGYGPAIKSGRSIIFAVRENGLLTHGVEVSSGGFNQFYAAGNFSANSKIKGSVYDALYQAKLIS